MVACWELTCSVHVLMQFAALLERVAALAGPGEQLAPRELAAAPALQAVSERADNVGMGFA